MRDMTVKLALLIATCTSCGAATHAVLPLHDTKTVASLAPAGSTLFEVLEGPFAASADVDGDGVRELIVANRNLHEDHEDRANTVRAYSARRGWTCVLSLSGGMGFGCAIADAGDLDADGAEDLLITTGDLPDIEACLVQACSGRTGAVLWELRGDDLGSDLCGLGDVDGDGHADAAFTAVDVRGRPGVRVVSGRDGRTLWSCGWDPEDAARKSPVPYAWDWMGVAALGDSNGDGVPDLAVSAPAPAASGPARSQVRILSGRDGALLLTLPANLGSGEANQSLAAAGDLDGDGLGDVLVGGLDAARDAAHWDNMVTALSGSDGHVLWRAFDSAPADEFGSSVAGVGDANGDGIPDVLVGAPTPYADSKDSGHAVLLSGADGAVIHRFEGAHATDEQGAEWVGEGFCFGWCVAAAGDVNGDGLADLIVGEDRYFTMGMSAADRVVVLAGGRF